MQSPNSSENTFTPLNLAANKNTFTPMKLTINKEELMEESEDFCPSVIIELPEGLVHHPLRSTWVLWRFTQEKGRSWEDSLHEMHTIDSVENFWVHHYQTPPPSQMPMNSDYYLFKQDIQPKWEDAANKDGGRWLYSMNKGHGHAAQAKQLDHYWLELMMALVGEQFGKEGELVCGAAVNIRHKGSKLVLWTQAAHKKEEMMAIGRAMKEKLGCDRKETLRYEAHQDAARRQGSNIAVKLSV
jgi:translation initiation factor 4E